MGTKRSNIGATLASNLGGATLGHCPGCTDASFRPNSSGSPPPAAHQACAVRESPSCAATNPGTDCTLSQGRRHIHRRRCPGHCLPLDGGWVPLDSAPVDKAAGRDISEGASTTGPGWGERGGGPLGSHAGDGEAVVLEQSDRWGRPDVGVTPTAEGAHGIGPWGRGVGWRRGGGLHGGAQRWGVRTEMASVIGQEPFKPLQRTSPVGDPSWTPEGCEGVGIWGLGASSRSGLYAGGRGGKGMGGPRAPGQAGGVAVDEQGDREPDSTEVPDGPSPERRRAAGGFVGLCTDAVDGREREKERRRTRLRKTWT